MEDQIVLQLPDAIVISTKWLWFLTGAYFTFNFTVIASAILRTEIEFENETFLALSLFTVVYIPLALFVMLFSPDIDFTLKELFLVEDSDDEEGEEDAD